VERAVRSVLLVLVVLCVVLIPAGLPEAKAQDHSMHHGHGDPMADNAAPVDNPDKLLADKKESEFNHHLAGFFVALGGAFILFQAGLRGKWPIAKYIWPASFLISGVFVFIWSDTELWPFGHRQWLETLENNREVLQHKTFAILLLGLGGIEWLRVSGKLKTAWSALVFPVLAVGGSVLLLFHQHQGGMHGPNHMELMMRIQSEHLSYAVVGIGIGLTKALAELKNGRQQLFGRVWPILMVALGVLLMFYRE
jgi:hypothetical protein